MAKLTAILKSKKAKPFIIGGIVLLAGVVIFILIKNAAGSASGGASAQTSGPSEALQAAQLQANTQTTIAQIQANTVSTQYATQLAAALDTDTTQVNLAGITADSHHDDNMAALQAYMAGQQTQQYVAGLNAQTANLGIQQSAAVQIAGVNAQTAIAQSQFSYLTTQATLNADVQNNVTKAQVQLGTGQTKAASKASTLSTIGTVAVAALAFFSDARLKKSITWTGIRDDNISTYRWEYNGMMDKTPRMGYLAQQVGTVYPGAVMTDRASGMLKIIPSYMHPFDAHGQS